MDKAVNRKKKGSKERHHHSLRQDLCRLPRRLPPSSRWARLVRGGTVGRMGPHHLWHHGLRTAGERC